MAPVAFASGWMSVTARREASSMQICTLAGSLEPVAFTGSIPTHAAAVALARAVPCHAVTDPVEPAQALDIKMDKPSRHLVFIANDRCCGFDIPDPGPTPNRSDPHA